MPADERIKVTFKRVYVLDDADWFGSGEFYFIASVDGQSVGNRSRIFNAVERTWINLPEAEWSAIVNVQNKTSVEVSFQGKDEDLFFDDDLGTITRTLRPPWEQRLYRRETENFILEWTVELAVQGAFGMHPPSDVFACRESAGGVSCTTVSGTGVTARLEFHPVIPMPSDAPVAPGGTLIFPPRPVFPAGTAAPRYNPKNGGISVSPGDPINVMINPAAIPILSPPAPSSGAAPALPGGAPPRVTDDTAARIEFTFYRPGTLNFADDDPRLEWTIVSVSGGGAAQFLGAARGVKVKVYGTARGEVRLEVRFNGALFAAYRAVVLPVKQVPCRFNILNGPHASSQPRSAPADIQQHLAITNRFLRQMALELVLDTNATVTNGAHATTIPGIFRISVSAGATRNIPVSGFVNATRLNHRTNVMNFAYIHSDASGNLGAASDYPASNAGGTITDSGTPSASWNLPSGVLPDAAAAAVNMTLLAARQRAGHPQLFAMYVTDANGAPTVLANQQTYAGTIAHEFGHILNLGHRVDSAGSPFNDNVNHPPGENLMHFNNPTNIAQDFDILQALAAHRSPLVPP